MCIRDRASVLKGLPLGRSVNAEQLVEKVSGRPLSTEAFLGYLESKLDRLHQASQPLQV